MGFQSLPVDCVAHILSYTTPADACRLSLVSWDFCSAAEFDYVWNPFIVSRSDSQSSLLGDSPSKKALYLSDRPIIIAQARKSFQLDRKSGKKCYMLAARALTIVWGDTPQYWNWLTLPDSRFPEVAELLDVCWLEIRGMINTLYLSPNTQYAAYLVFKMINSRGFHHHPVKLSVGIVGGHSSTKNVCLDPNFHGFVGLQRPNVRSDGWLEIEMGEYFNSGLEDEEVEMTVLETNGGEWKRSLFVQGIEVRPKEGN